MNKKKKQQRIDEKVNSILSIGPSKCDPLGMYTGKPVNINEVPVQDNDDL